MCVCYIYVSVCGYNSAPPANQPRQLDSWTSGALLSADVIFLFRRHLLFLSSWQQSVRKILYKSWSWLMKLELSGATGITCPTARRGIGSMDSLLRLLHDNPWFNQDCWCDWGWLSCIFKGEVYSTPVDLSFVPMHCASSSILDDWLYCAHRKYALVSWLRMSG